MRVCKECGGVNAEGGRIAHFSDCAAGRNASQVGAGPAPDARLQRYDSAVRCAAKADDVLREARRALVVAQMAEREARELANAATMVVLEIEAEMRGERPTKARADGEGGRDGADRLVTGRLIR